jgi:hypothetical protein
MYGTDQHSYIPTVFISSQQGVEVKFQCHTLANVLSFCHKTHRLHQLLGIGHGQHHTLTNILSFSSKKLMLASSIKPKRKGDEKGNQEARGT